MKKTLLILAYLCLTAGVAQNGWFSPFDKKGDLGLYWGYNRSAFTNSDISFEGADYNFTLYEVEAVDKPAPVGSDPYLTASGFTVPQYNYKVSYFVGKRLSIGIGMDHMKYVMVQDQTVKATGYIEYSPDENTTIRREYNNDDIVLTEDFLQFEHTDGLNYLNIEADYYSTLYRFSEKFAIHGLVGGGIGGLIPKSNVKLLGYERNDTFHWAGFGLDAKVGLSIDLFKYIFLQTELKGGYINMPDVLVMPGDVSDRASHDFYFVQWMFVIGGHIPLGK